MENRPYEITTDSRFGVSAEGGTVGCRSWTLKDCMRPRVQSPFRAQTDRGLWDSSLRICKCLCEHGRQSVRRLARQTGLSQSRVHRLTQAMERRTSSPASWFWESADGRQWLTRLVVATLDPCGLQCGVGRDTLSEFFTRRHLATQVGGAASAFRGVCGLGLPWGAAGVGGGGGRDSPDVGAGRDRSGGGGRGHWRCGRDMLATPAAGLAGCADRVATRGSRRRRAHWCPMAREGGGTAQGPGTRGPLSGQCPSPGCDPARRTRLGVPEYAGRLA